MLHRVTELGQRVQWNLSPPRLRFEDAVIDVAARQSRDLDAVAVLADAVGSRRTTAERLTMSLEARGRVRRRDWLRRVLDDIGAGAWSVLEHGYLTKVERPHGLPAALRQVRHVGELGTQYRDAALPGLIVVELDGRIHHSGTEQRDRDLDRDLDATGASRVGRITAPVLGRLPGSTRLILATRRPESTAAAQAVQRPAKRSSSKPEGPAAPGSPLARR